MNVDTDECFSKIYFQANGIEYRSYWRQSRAKRAKKEETKFGDETTRLDQYDPLGNEWKRIASSKDPWKTGIVKALGLDFTQFCRSVLIAQGQFRQFLDAKKEDKIASLETLTKTEIFGQI